MHTKLDIYLIIVAILQLYGDHKFYCWRKLGNMLDPVENN